MNQTDLKQTGVRAACENKIKNLVKLFIKNRQLLRKAGIIYENIKYFLLFFINYPVEYCVYRYALYSNRPYFGLIMQAGLTAPVRALGMKKTVEVVKEHTGFVNILEIGSWAGGSALVWTKAIDRFNAGNGRVLCVDPWKSYISLKDNNTPRFLYRQMESALKNGDIVRLFNHNIKAAGADDKVIPIRGGSKDVLPYLGKETFDIIYIDGDHSYDGVISDLELSGKLLKNNGIICGDDLELQFPQVDGAHNEAFKQHDFVVDPLQDTSYHPGVARAVWEYFKTEVSLYNGFWLMRKKNDSWEKVVLF
jgi:predicted O-methyltransferase YrrM